MIRGIEINLSLPDYPNMLPTNPQIAKRGVEEFSRLAHLLSPTALEVFANSLQMRRCFTGTSPEVGSVTVNLLPDGTPPSIAEIRELIASESKGFLVVKNPKAKFGFSVFNLAATEQTATNYPLIFPNTLPSGLSDWLQNYQNWMEDGANELLFIRHGLLSGFPYSATKSYPEYDITFSHLLPRLKGSEAKRFDRYLFGEVKRDEQAKQALLRIAKHRLGLLSDIQIEVIAAAFLQTSQAVGAFITLGDPQDKIYANQIDRLYRRSDIDSVADRLLREESSS